MVNNLIIYVPHHLFSIAVLTIRIGIPDKPPAIVRLPQHLDHRANVHRHLVILLS